MQFDEFLARHRSRMEKSSPFEVLFAETVLSHLQNLDFDHVGYQTPFRDERKNRYIDFTIEEPPGVRIALEVDGYDKKGRGSGPTREEHDDSTRRQNALMDDGWRLLRFTNRRVLREPGACAAEIQRALEKERGKSTPGYSPAPQPRAYQGSRRPSYPSRPWERRERLPRFIRVWSVAVALSFTLFLLCMVLPRLVGNILLAPVRDVRMAGVSRPVPSFSAPRVRNMRMTAPAGVPHPVPAFSAAQKPVPSPQPRKSSASPKATPSATVSASPWLAADGVPLTRAPDGAVLKRGKRFYSTGPHQWRVVSADGHTVYTTVGPEQADSPKATPSPTASASPWLAADGVPLTWAPDGAVLKRGKRFYSTGPHQWRVVSADGHTVYTNVGPEQADSP